MNWNHAITQDYSSDRMSAREGSADCLQERSVAAPVVGEGH